MEAWSWPLPRRFASPTRRRYLRYEGQRGIFVGGGGAVRIQRIIGYPTMADMMLTGRVMSAAEAVAARLVQYLVPAGESLAHARKGRWIAQRYFAAHVNHLGEAVNYGIYLVAGEAAGIYARVHDAPTDDQAVSVPALVRDASSLRNPGSKTPSTRTE